MVGFAVELVNRVRIPSLLNFGQRQSSCTYMLSRGIGLCLGETKNSRGVWRVGSNKFVVDKTTNNRLGRTGSRTYRQLCCFKGTKRDEQRQGLSRQGRYPIGTRVRVKGKLLQAGWKKPRASLSENEGKTVSAKARRRDLVCMMGGETNRGREALYKRRGRCSRYSR